MRKISLAVLFSSLLLFTGAAIAQEPAGEMGEMEGMEEVEAPPVRRAPPSFDRNGVYFGLAAVYAFGFFDEDPLEARFGAGGTRLSLDSSNSWGINGRLGYRFHPNLAAEVGAEWYQNFELEEDQGADVVRIDGVNVTMNGKLYPLTGRIQPYGLVGAGFGYADITSASTEALIDTAIDEDEFAFTTRYGLGIDLYLFHDVAFTAEAAYVLPFGDLNDYPLLSIVFGGTYRF